jgi:hypothetical protein
MMGFTDVVRKAFPYLSIAASAGGPLGSMAAAAVGRAIGADKTPSPTADSIQAVMATAFADPTQRAAMIKEEHDFQAQMAELGYKSEQDFEATAAADRASARAREIAVRDNTPRILAYVYAFGFFVTLGAEIWMAVSGVEINPLASKSIDILLGVLTGMVLGTKEYYFGSSAGSERKTELLAQAPAIQSK